MKIQELLEQIEKNNRQELDEKGLAGPLAAGLLSLGFAGLGKYSMDQANKQTYNPPTHQTSQVSPSKSTDQEVHLYRSNKDLNDLNRSAELEKNDEDKKEFYKIGSPYKMNGVVYKPKYDPHYNKVGTASWYGEETHGKQTANAHKFDYNEIAAAHPTLPIPSIVKVKNLENGRIITVVINDRGPYAKGRIIDLTKAAAEKLGFHQGGTAKVQVQYDKAATEKYLKKVGLFDQYQEVALKKKPHQQLAFNK